MTSTVSNLYDRILIYQELPWWSIQFHDYPGLANELLWLSRFSMTCKNLEKWKLYVFSSRANIMIGYNKIDFFFLIADLLTEEERVRRLRNVLTPYNFRLELPQKNISTQSEAEALFPEEYEKFLREYEPLKKLQGNLSLFLQPFNKTCFMTIDENPVYFPTQLIPWDNWNTQMS